MKERTVKIYSCDHCKRKQLRQRAAMVRHEARCIYNVDRVCGFCEFIKRDGGDPLHCHSLKALVAVLWDHDFERLKKEAGGCPGCILAAIVQQRVEATAAGELGEIEHIGNDVFDYAKAKAEFFTQFDKEQGQGGRYW